MADFQISCCSNARGTSGPSQLEQLRQPTFKNPLNTSKDGQDIVIRNIQGKRNESDKNRVNFLMPYLGRRTARWENSVLFKSPRFNPWISNYRKRAPTVVAEKNPSPWRETVSQNKTTAR